MAQLSRRNDCPRGGGVVYCPVSFHGTATMNNAQKHAQFLARYNALSTADQAIL